MSAGGRRSRDRATLRVRSTRSTPSGKARRRRLFPNLKQVVVFGHSGGGQVVQRYAIAVKGDQVLLREGIGVRYVVAKPVLIRYFSKERPEPAIAASCNGYNSWKFGMDERHFISPSRQRPRWSRPMSRAA